MKFYKVTFTESLHKNRERSIEVMTKDEYSATWLIHDSYGTFTDKNKLVPSDKIKIVKVEKIEKFTDTKNNTQD